MSKYRTIDFSPYIDQINMKIDHAIVVIHPLFVQAALHPGELQIEQSKVYIGMNEDGSLKSEIHEVCALYDPLTKLMHTDLYGQTH